MPKIVPLPASRPRKIFEKAGFKCVRIEGDHFVYTKKGISRPVVIPDWFACICRAYLMRRGLSA